MTSLVLCLLVAQGPVAAPQNHVEKYQAEHLRWSLEAATAATLIATGSWLTPWGIESVIQQTVVPHPVLPAVGILGSVMAAGIGVWVAVAAATFPLPEDALAAMGPKQTILTAALATRQLAQAYVILGFPLTAVGGVSLALAVIGFLADVFNGRSAQANVWLVVGSVAGASTAAGLYAWVRGVTLHRQAADQLAPLLLREQRERQQTPLEGSADEKPVLALESLFPPQLSLRW